MESVMRGNTMSWAVIIIVGALIAGLTAITYYSYRQDILAARARVSSGSHVINTACGSIEYAVAEKGPAVLVVHGAGGGFDQGLEFGQPLIDNGFQVIAMSRFGYLRTPLSSDASPKAQADAHACLLDALNLRRVAVLGGSAGTPSAMQLCLRHPERCSAMVLLVPLAFAPRTAAELQQQSSTLTQFVINTTLRSDFVFWVATKFAHDTMVKTILDTRLTDFRNASPEERARSPSVAQHPAH
jgi:pimeloyl-ACP methyl ester carboxylesterase